MKLISYTIAVYLLFASGNVDISFAESEDCKCGQSLGSSSMIIRGSKVHPKNKYPWVVKLKMPKSEGLCTGAIISKDYILTAAHCLPTNGIAKNADIIVVFLDETTCVASELHIHPGFKMGVGNDIALLKLKHRIKCDNHKSPICLPPSDYKVKEGSSVIITGWGQTEFGVKQPETVSKSLKEGRMSVYRKDEKCGVEIDDKPNHYDHEKEHCTLAKGRDQVCFGDSGGITFYDIDSRKCALGVLSRGITDACKKKTPSIYTDVPFYMPWISKTTGIPEHMSSDTSLKQGTSDEAKKKQEEKEECEE